MRKILKWLDDCTNLLQGILTWAVPCLLGLICVEVALRYLAARPTQWIPEIIMMLGPAIYVFGWGYVWRADRHIRIDVIYSRQRPRVRAAIDVVCTLIFLLPLVGFLTYSGGQRAVASFVTDERSTWTMWYPVLWPIRSVVFVGLCLFALHSLARLFRDAYLLVRGEAYD